MKLDRLDYKIIYELDKDLRASYAAMAKKLYVSKQTVKNRVEKLIENKVLTHLITVINMQNFGVFPQQIFLSLHHSSEEKKKELIDYLVEHPKISQVAVCEGVFDIYFGLAAPNPAEFDHELTKIYTLFSDQIKDKKLVTFIDTRLYPYDFLIDKQRESIPENRGFHKRSSSPPIQVKEIDGKILDCLANDARIPFSELAGKLQISVQTVMNRVNFLKKNNIIVGYMFLLDSNVFLQHQILLNFSAIPKELEDRLMSFCASQPNAVFVVKMLGEFDFAITLTSKKFEEYLCFINEFKRQFASDLKSFVPLLVTDFPKLNFVVPEDESWKI